MVALSKQHGGWDLPLDRPIEVEHGDQLLSTLGEVGAYILALPETVQRQELWDAAAETFARSGEVRSYSTSCNRISFGGCNVWPEHPKSLEMTRTDAAGNARSLG